MGVAMTPGRQAAGRLGRDGQQHAALRILNERLARGEIDAGEYAPAAQC